MRSATKAIGPIERKKDVFMARSYYKYTNPVLRKSAARELSTVSRFVRLVPALLAAERAEYRSSSKFLICEHFEPPRIV